ncbi:MAG: hybrid sensor histidine kinase/response regulator transcription factor, partial [Bacteroidota bacterium]
QFLDEIVLPPSNRSFELVFGSTDMRFPEDNSYSFFLEGYDKDWSPPRKGNNRVRYENLPKGKYTLHLKAGLFPEQLDGSERLIDIRVIPPWYQTNMAYIGFIIFTSLIIFGVYRYNLKRQFALAESERLKELDSFKGRMYANITHEFRTPLTVILGMVDQIKGYAGPVQMIKRNGEHLLDLVNQLLDMSKLDHAELSLNLVQGDVIRFLNYLGESFQSYAEAKHLKLTVYAEIDELEMAFDDDKLGKVLSNLLSNAIKFTPEYGKIIVHIFQEEIAAQKQLCVKVQDTGIGIPETQLDAVFDRFYQVDNKSTRKAEGTGIGLSLCKDLMEFMGGSIEVKSQENKGSTFTVRLPIRKDQGSAPLLFEPYAKQNIKEKSTLESTNSKGSKGEKAEILVIEDNQDVATYIRSCLEQDYHIHHELNGKRGVAYAQENIPDFIISDVMMPELDGLEATAILKSDERTNHIPIILLTAKAEESDKLEGLRSGADAYLTKPFNRDELQIRIDQMLQLRQRLQVVSSNTSKGEKVDPVEQANQDFMAKIYALILEHLDKPTFSIQDLETQLGLSQMQLYRKLKAVGDTTPNKLIRKIRLEKGLELLKTTDLTISEIAYDIGFSDPNYFSRAFHSAFGHPPSHFRK